MEKDKNDRVEVIKLPSNLGSNGSFSNKPVSGKRSFVKLPTIHQLSSILQKKIGTMKAST
jgi:hypothetical protein